MPPSTHGPSPSASARVGRSSQASPTRPKSAASENPLRPASAEMNKAGTSGIRNGGGDSGRSAQSRNSVGSSSALMRPKMLSPSRSPGSSESSQDGMDIDCCASRKCPRTHSTSLNLAALLLLQPLLNILDLAPGDGLAVAGEPCILTDRLLRAAFPGQVDYEFGNVLIMTDSQVGENQIDLALQPGNLPVEVAPGRRPRETEDHQDRE